MANNKRVSGTAKSMPGGVGLGVAVSMVITVAGAAVLAWLILSERMAQGAVGYGSMVILVLASLAGCLTACGAVRRRRMMVCGITGAGYYLGLLMIALLFGGRFQGMGVTALMVLLGGAIAVILGLAGKGSGGRRYKIPAYR